MKKLAIALIAALLIPAAAFAAGKEIKIGVTPFPHKDIMNVVKQLVAKEGYDLKIVEFTDYVTPNTALAEKSLDANFFQHIPYLEGYNASVEEDKQLVAVVFTHFEPMGIYPGQKSSLEDLAEGDVIGVPNDPVNMTRAFILLADAGLIELPEGTTLDSEVTKYDIINPKGLEIQEVNAELAPTLKAGAAFAVINGNSASDNGLIPGRDAVYFEQPGSQAAEAYVNVFVVKPENAEADFVKALEQVIYTQKVYDLIVESGFAPVFEVADAE